MADISHTMRGDLALSPSGDLAGASAATLTQQRVLRRLLTNPGDYIWHVDYGAGLPQFVGETANAVVLQGIIEQQMDLERGVGASPPPVATVTDAGGGNVIATVRYADQDGSLRQASFTP